MLTRIRNSIRYNNKLIQLIRNWPSVIVARKLGLPLEIRLRNGAVIQGESGAHLDFLFSEIWIESIYSPRGFEIRPGDTVLDIGANIGVFSIFAATRHPTVTVYSYEPCPDNALQLRANIHSSGLANVRTVQAALGGSAGKRKLVRHATNRIVHFVPQEAASEGIEIDCITLEKAMDVDSIGHINLLKLDCEGSEYEILRAAGPETMRRIERIVGEFHPRPGITDAVQELAETLQAHSFAVECVRHGQPNHGMFFAVNTRFAANG